MPVECVGWEWRVKSEMHEKEIRIVSKRKKERVRSGQANNLRDKDDVPLTERTKTYFFSLSFAAQPGQRVFGWAGWSLVAKWK